MSEIENLTERELLIQQGTSIEILCKTFATLQKENREDHKEIFDVVRGVDEKKVPNKLFYWVLGFIILFIIGISGFTGNLKSDVVKNTEHIKHIEEGLN